MRASLRLLIVLAMAAPGCPAPADDDDTTPADDDDTTPEGLPPSLDQVEVCEVPIDEMDCGDQNALAFAVEYRLTMSDPDGDLVLPRYCLAIEDNPFNCESIEGTVPSGGTIAVTVPCRRWDRGEPSAYEAYIRDMEGNESERVSGSWDVQVQPGDADCD